MADETRTLPLTPTMRATLQGWLTGQFRQTIALILGLMAIFAVIMVCAVLAMTASIEIAFATTLVLGGLTLMTIGLVVVYQRRVLRRALQAGVYARYSGVLSTTTIHVRGATLRHLNA